MRPGNSKPATVDRLSDELDQLSAQLQRIGAQLRHLGETGDGPEPVAPGNYPAMRPVYTPPAPAEPAPAREPEPARWTAPPAEARKPSLDERLRAHINKEGFSSRLLAWVGGVITLLGLVLALALAIQRGYLGPLPRVLGGLLLCAGLLIGALRLHRKPSGRPGAFAMTATGIAGIYLDVIAATTLYHFLPGYVGLLVGFAIALAGLGLAGQWNSQLLACFVVLGCVVCAPILTHGITPLLAAFLLVLKAATAPVQLRRNWPGLGIAAGLPALAASVLAGATTAQDDPLPAAGIALVTAVLLGTVAVLTARRRPEDPAGYGLLLTAPVPALILAPMLAEPVGRWLAIAVTAGLLGLWAASQFLAAAKPPARFTGIAGALAALAVLQTTAIFTGGTPRTLMLLAEAVLLAVVAVRLRSKGTLLTALIYAVAGWLLVLLRECAPDTLTRVPSPFFPQELLVNGMLAGALGAVTAGILAWAGYRLEVLGTPRRALDRWVLVAAGVLYGSAAAVLNAALLVAPDQTGFLTGHVLITLGWTVAGLAMLLRYPGSLVLRIAGLALACAAVAKLAVFDLAALDGLARVTVALGAGLALLLVGARHPRGTAAST